jgi:hypothetical protein
MSSIIFERLMRKPAEATASSRIEASTLLSSCTWGARTCRLSRLMARVCTGTVRTCNACYQQPNKQQEEESEWGG